jgi:peptide/nickel transport system permease protein
VSTTLKDVARRFVRNRLAVVGLVICLLLIMSAIFAEFLMPMDPTLQSLEDKRTPPGATYWLGADEFGRDILSRVILGTRVALLVANLSVGIALVLGITLGTAAGFLGGWVDSVIGRIVDMMLAFPYLLLAIAVVAATGPGVLNTTIAVGVWATPTFTRIVRSAVIATRERDYIQAAKAIGANDLRVIWKHVLPNIISPLIVYSTLYMANAIMLEAALSFLGLGVQPPDPSWGLMIASGRDFLRIAPHIATIPGLAIMLSVLGFNLLGDGLRDALDPKLKNRL